MPKTSRTAHRGRLLAAAAALLAASLAACSQQEDGKADEVTNATYEQQLQDWRTKFDDCLRKEGIDLPKSTGDGSTDPIDLNALGVTMDEMDAASRTCTSKVGNLPVDPDMPSTQELFQAQLKFARCMRAAGYEYADPEPPAEDGSGGGAGPAMSADDFDKADLARCEKEAGLATLGGGK